MNLPRDSVLTRASDTSYRQALAAQEGWHGLLPNGDPRWRVLMARPGVAERLEGFMAEAIRSSPDQLLGALPWVLELLEDDVIGFALDGVALAKLSIADVAVPAAPEPLVIAGECLECGDTFQWRRRGGSPPVTCSRACRILWRRRRKRMAAARSRARARQ